MCRMHGHATEHLTVLRLPKRGTHARCKTFTENVGRPGVISAIGTVTNCTHHALVGSVHTVPCTG